MSQDEPAQWIVPTTGAKTLPAVEILTGRGFICGKSGSGKSNTGSVIAEELLDNGYNLLIVDTEGEYYGLKESYEVLHVGNDAVCDVQVGPEHAEKLAEIALHRNVPIVLDVSDFLDAETARELIGNVVRELYRMEKDARKPFLVMVEEMQEYLPQTGGSTELSELLERVAKRGRKRGIGILGMSQRPAAVDKDFITQCDWMVWHRLNWKTDLDVVRNILGSDRAEAVEEFETGEAFLMTDWDDTVERVQFKRKRTHDAGATPGLESYERPDMKSVGDDLLAEIRGVSGPAHPPRTTGGGTDSGDPGDFDALEAAAAQAAADRAGNAGNRPDDPIDAAAAGEGNQIALPDLEIQPPDVDVVVSDLEGMAEEELREVASAVVRRNRILEDEIRELRSILAELERPAGRRPARSGTDRTAAPSGSTDSTPTPPTPPGRPPERSGVGGTLLEVMELTTFMFRVMRYKLAMTKYRWTASATADREQ